MLSCLNIELWVQITFFPHFKTTVFYLLLLVFTNNRTASFLCRWTVCSLEAFSYSFLITTILKFHMKVFEYRSLVILLFSTYWAFSKLVCLQSEEISSYYFCDYNPPPFSLSEFSIRWCWSFKMASTSYDFLFILSNFLNLRLYSKESLSSFNSLIRF